MKRILYLIRYELKALKTTIILIALILIVFMSVLCGVLFVNGDLMRNLCENLNSKSEIFNCYIMNSSFQSFEDEFSNRIITSSQNTFSKPKQIESNGRTFEMRQEFTDETGSLQIYIMGGTMVIANKAVCEELKYNDHYILGRWVENDYEICLSRFVAESLNAVLGDNVFIGDQEFALVGIYDWPNNSDISCGLSYAFIFTAGRSDVIDILDVHFKTSEEMFNSYLKLKDLGYNCNCDYSSYYESFNIVRAVLISISALLSVVIIVAQYSLISILFRQRKFYICRLKMLGASEFLVSCVYIGVLMIILFFVSCVAAILGGVINAYFMSICERLFNFAFTIKYISWIPITIFLVSAFLSILLWYIVNKKIKQRAVAEAIRYE